MENGVPLLDTKSGVPALRRRIWQESILLWRIVGPAIFQRVALYSANVVTQAFAGHLGDMELAAISIAVTVISGFNFGLLLGMASALETLCGQAFGAKRYDMLGIYLQRSWIVLFLFAVLLLPIYIYTEDLLLLLGEPGEMARQAGQMSIWIIPQHFAFAFFLPLNRYLQSQMKNYVPAIISGVALAVDVFLSWLLIYKFQLGLIGAAIGLDASMWVMVFGMLVYVVAGGCPETWSGFSLSAFQDLWGFTKLSVSSGVMLCLENWYYRILVLLTGYLKNAEIAVDALSICMTINGWELMIPLAFFAGTGVRVANELGAGNGQAAKFATIVSVSTSFIIGLVFSSLILLLRHKFALIFTSSAVVLGAVDHLSILLALSILLNSIQPILSGVAVGSGWQILVAYINIGCYYLIGLPAGILLGWAFHLEVPGIWSGMIGGTLAQTIILVYLTVKCDWDEQVDKTRNRLSKYRSST